MTLRSVSLNDKYELGEGAVFASGMQALVRLLLQQARRDQASGIDTAGFVSGYPGSPIGGLDLELAKEKSRLEASGIRFQPGVNEDLAATAVLGTQQLGVTGDSKKEGVFSLWYGKGPGVDRSIDALKHGARYGAASKGGVLIVAGDDHAAKSSSISHQSQQALASAGIPVLYPSSIREVIEFGLFAWAMSRYSACWAGMKLVNETAEGSTTFDLCLEDLVFVEPDLAELTDHLRRPVVGFDPKDDERLLFQYRIPAAQAFCRANSIDRVMITPTRKRLGIVAAGKEYQLVKLAFGLLGLSEPEVANLGIGLYKPGLIWPLEAKGVQEFSRGYQELFFIEEKQAFIEQQASRILYDLEGDERPEIVGKNDELGQPLVPGFGTVTATDLARLIAARLRRLGSEFEAPVTLAEAGVGEGVPPCELRRLPYYCSGCPHNRSTKVPEGSVALSGIGCHSMAMWMERRTLPPTHMGAEGANWTGMAPFSKTSHVFQNMGDGTYYHSGLLAIRAAISSGQNITYKILLNGTVAMTGGQPILGEYSADQIAQQLAAENVARIAIVTDSPSRYSKRKLPGGTLLEPREMMDSMQERFREISGVSVIIFDQPCATKLRRERKRGKLEAPDHKVFINDAVCEGCGDCSKRANCVSIVPKETLYGRKRQIEQSSCNLDATCIEGFCPSFVTVHGGTAKRQKAGFSPDSIIAELPTPAVLNLTSDYNIIIAGVGGTGIITLGSILAMAAHLEEKSAAVYDMTGLAQKGGAVYGHLRIASGSGDIATTGIEAGQADLMIAGDSVAAVTVDAVSLLNVEYSRVVVNESLIPTADFQLDGDMVVNASLPLHALAKSVGGSENYYSAPASKLALKLLGDTIGANLMMVGYAYQIGALPLDEKSILRAVELNGVAVDFNKSAFWIGRIAAHDSSLLQVEDAVDPLSIESDISELINNHTAFLTAYQNGKYGEQYRRLIVSVIEAGERCGDKNSELAVSVARSYFKLMAYKDEYEVGRLHTSPEFEARLRDTFEGNFKLRYHLSPPILKPFLERGGFVGKISLGAWMRYPFKALAAMRFLRGTPLDMFGYGTERRMERALIPEFEAVVKELLETLDKEKLSAAIEIARLPMTVRGFGHVKIENVGSYHVRLKSLMDRWRTPNMPAELEFVEEVA